MTESVSITPSTAFPTDLPNYTQDELRRRDAVNIALRIVQPDPTDSRGVVVAAARRIEEFIRGANASPSAAAPSSPDPQGPALNV